MDFDIVQLSFSSYLGFQWVCSDKKDLLKDQAVCYGSRCTGSCAVVQRLNKVMSRWSLTQGAPLKHSLGFNCKFTTGMLTTGGSYYHCEEGVKSLVSLYDDDAGMTSPLKFINHGHSLCCTLSKHNPKGQAKC